MNNRVIALAKYLDIKPEEIELSDERINAETEYRTPVGMFFVMDEDEAFEAVKIDQENFLDDLGIEGYTEEFQKWILENAVDQEPLEEFCLEDFKSYAEDISYESDATYGNRLNQECVDAKIIDFEDIKNGKYTGNKDLVDELANYNVERIRNEEGFAEWFMFNFGNDYFRTFVKNNNISVDIDAISRELIEWDGYGHVLSRWDGKTIYLDDDLMAFKQEDHDLRENIR